MKWHHLPIAGGWYDQDPRVCEGFRFIWAERGKKEVADAKTREREMKSKRR